MSDPQWLVNAEKYKGFHETGNNQGIGHFTELAHTGEGGDPWCAIFVNACVEEAGVKGTRSPAARSFTHSSNFVEIDEPRRGAIFVRWRGSPTAATGHTGFVLDWPHVIAGNEGDAVKEYDEDPDKLLGFYWPKATVARPAARFQECLAIVLHWEGGNDDDPRDPGGRTSRGILQEEWTRWRKSHPDLPSDVWDAPQDQVEAIYREKYWDIIQGDELPRGVDLAVFDYGVNSGPSRAVKALQAIVGTDTDGEVGPLTIAGARSQNPTFIVNALCDQRMAFLRGLTKLWPTFGNGWTNRVNDVRAQSLKSAQGTPGPDHAPQPAPEPVPVPEQRQLPPPQVVLTPDEWHNIQVALSDAAKIGAQAAKASAPVILPLLLRVVRVVFPQAAPFLALAQVILTQFNVMGGPALLSERPSVTGTVMAGGLLSMFWSGLWSRLAPKPQEN